MNFKIPTRILNVFFNNAYVFKRVVNFILEFVYPQPRRDGALKISLMLRFHNKSSYFMPAALTNITDCSQR